MSANNFDLVIPIIHGVGAEDGELQFFLKNLGLPYIFSDPETHQACIDKKKTKEILCRIGVICPQETNIFPLFVKPCFGGSSIGAKICKNQKELDIFFKQNFGVYLLKEEHVKGREFTVGVIEHKNKIQVLPIVEIIPKEEFFDFESKYNIDNLAREICPANISKNLQNDLQDLALKIHSILKVKHISRSDFLVTKDNQIYFLEINTIPGMTNTSLIPKILKVTNISFRDLLKEWCMGILESKKA